MLLQTKQPQTDQQDRSATRLSLFQPTSKKLSISPLKLGDCKKGNCTKLQFKLNLCKYHFCNQIRTLLSKDFRSLYGGAPETAYASMDFRGKGFITQEDLLESRVVQKYLGKIYTHEDLQTFLTFFNLFPLKGGNRQHQTDSGHQPRRAVMIFDTFKKTFFAHLHQTFNITEIMNDAANEDSNKITNRNLKQPEYVKERLRKLETFLKDKFQKNWVSVRKAFLDLDTDHDGFISVEDIIHYFGTDNEFSYQDLKKLLQDKDSERGRGLLSYQDFSRWVGNSIHSVQGFYFRHDSLKNPGFEQQQRKYSQKIGQYSQDIAKGMVNQDQAIRIILDKIASQWKTIKKSFHDFSKDQSGSIDPQELHFYLNHWGLHVTDSTFKRIYEELDWDKDGRISYTDFQKTVGCEIHPGEDLYFRQDKPTMLRINTCKHGKCWQPTKQGKHFCYLHIKVNEDIANAYLMQIYREVGEKRWRPFIQEVRRKAETQDHNEIRIETLKNILQKHKFNMKDSDKEHLLDTYPGEDEGQRLLVNISALHQMRHLQAISQTYTEVNVDESGSDKEGPVDLNGFTGEQHARVDSQKLKPISDDELCDVITSSDKTFAQVMRLIKSIDKDNNGYVTVTELDDILRLEYPKELGQRDMMGFIRRFRSIQNRILVDYKKFRDYIITHLKKKKEDHSLLTPMQTKDIFFATQGNFRTLDDQRKSIDGIKMRMAKAQFMMDHNQNDINLRGIQEESPVIKQQQPKLELNLSTIKKDVVPNRAYSTLSEIKINRSSVVKPSQTFLNSRNSMNENIPTTNTDKKNPFLITALNRKSLNQSLLEQSTTSNGDRTYQSLVKARSFLNDGNGKQNKMASRFMNKSVNINRKKIQELAAYNQEDDYQMKTISLIQRLNMKKINVVDQKQIPQVTLKPVAGLDKTQTKLTPMKGLPIVALKTNQAVKERDFDIQSQLTQTIKDFRKELKDSDLKTRDSFTGSTQLNGSVEKFRKTLQNFGLDVSNKTLTKIMKEQ